MCIRDSNLAMVKRSKSFSAGAIVEGVRFPAESLKQKFQALVEAAVNRRRAGIGPLLSPALGSEVLGEIGAVALSEGFQVQGIRSDPADTPVQAQVADQGLPPVDRAEIFTGYREKLREDRQVIAVFALSLIHI